MNCQTARDVLADVTRRIDHSQQEVESASEHVAACGACQVRFKALARAVLSDRDDEIPCAEARDHFVEYGAAVQAGGNVPAGLGPVAHHLQTCPDCAAEYASLEEMLAWAREEPLRVERAGPQFDLSFVAEPGSLWKVVNEKVNRLGEAIRVRVEPGAAALGEVSMALQVLQPAPVYALRGGEGETPPAESVVTIPDKEHSMQVRVGVTGGAEAEADLFVTVESLAPDSPLPGVRVALQDGEQHLLERQHAVERKSVVFEKLTPGQYWLVVQIGDRDWEISIPVSAGKRD